MPAASMQAHVLYHDHIDGRCIALFEAMRGNDLEGIVANGSAVGTDGQTTSWLKIRCPEYSQI